MQQNIEFERCIDFLVRMIDKYGDEVLRELEEEKQNKEEKVNLVTLTNYEAVLDSALKTGYINEEDVPVLDNWRKDPAHWEAGK